MNDDFSDFSSILQALNRNHRLEIDSCSTLVGSQEAATASISESKVDSHEGSARQLTKFDIIIGCDILFFKEYHKELIETLRLALSPSGTVYLLQPTRGSTMQDFISKASDVFNVQVDRDYDPSITAMRRDYELSNECNDAGIMCYDEEVHFPVLLTLTFKFHDAVLA